MNNFVLETQGDLTRRRYLSSIRTSLYDFPVSIHSDNCKILIKLLSTVQYFIILEWRLSGYSYHRRGDEVERLVDITWEIVL